MHQSIEAIGARSAALSRRASLLILGGVGLAALAHTAPARAGKVGNTAKKRCNRQIGQCAESVGSFCDRIAGSVEPAVCEALFLPCCQSFQGCQARAAYDCMFAGLIEPQNAQ